MPTFQFYKNKVKLDEVRGADPAALESKIKQHIGSETGDDDVGVPGHVIIFFNHSFVYLFFYSFNLLTSFLLPNSYLL